DDARAVLLDGDLGGAEDMPGQMKGDGHAADGTGLAQAGFLGGAGETAAIADRHDVQRLAGGEHGAVAGTGVVRVTVGDERARHRPDRVDVEVPLGTPEPFRAETQK